MRFVTYNIRLAIQEGVGAIADVIAAEQPDVVALQEVGLDWVMGPGGDTTAALAALLDLPYYRFARSISRGEAHYGHALLSRFPILRCNQHAWPTDVDEPRTYLVSEVSTPNGILHVLSTHLSHVTDRDIQGPLLLGEAIAMPDPCVVVGDLNGTIAEPFLAGLCEAFEDADSAKRRPTFPANDPTVRIDYLLARGATWRDVVVGENATASDHRYVAATLELTSSS